MVMEVLTVDRQNEFPQQIAPFPDPVDLTSAFDSASVPPQKLRPIRRSPSELRPRFLGEQIAYLDGAAELVGSDAVAVAEEEESLRPKSEWCGFTGLELEDEDSSSSEDDSGVDLFDDTKEPGNPKRKRKTREKMETFMVNLVMRVMDKQEKMNKQLIEMIEKREKERIIREEAWKQQEMERMKREEEMRAQETSRSLALISFIQNALGRADIQIPQSLMVSCAEGNRESDGETENHSEKDIMCNKDNRKWPETCDPNRRWPEAEVHTLIMLRTALEHKFRGMGSTKCPAWDEISAGMRNMGYDRSANKCKEKWENMNKYFKKMMGNGKKHVENSKVCPYFHDLDVLYKNGLVSPGIASNYENVGNTSDFTNYETDAKTI